MKKTLLIISGILVLTVQLCAQRQVEKSLLRGDTLYKVLPQGAIPAIFDPEFISLDSAESIFQPDELMQVASKGANVKAYSTWHLDHHEIVNDYIDGDAITVTW